MVLYGLNSVLVVVDVLLSVDGLGGLDMLLRSDVLLNNLGCGLLADLGGVLLVGSLEEVLDAVGNARHFIGICVGVWGFKSDKVN